jgi:hypothetical protein
MKPRAPAWIVAAPGGRVRVPGGVVGEASGSRVSGRSGGGGVFGEKFPHPGMWVLGVGVARGTGRALRGLGLGGKSGSWASWALGPFPPQAQGVA